MDDLVTYQERPSSKTRFELRVKLDAPSVYGGVRHGGLEIGTGGGYHSRYWKHVTREEAEGLIAQRDAHSAERKAEQAERKRVEAEEHAKILRYIDMSNVVKLPGPYNLYSLVVQAPIDDVVVPVQMVYNVTNATDFDWESGEEYDCLEVSVQVWTTRFAGTKRERVSNSAYSSTKTKSIADVLADTLKRAM